MLSLTATGLVHGIAGLGLFTRWLASGAASVIVVMVGSYLFWFRGEERKFLRDKGVLGARYLGRVLMPRKATEAA